MQARKYSTGTGMLRSSVGERNSVYAIRSMFYLWFQETWTHSRENSFIFTKMNVDCGEKVKHINVRSPIRRRFGSL